MSDVPKVRILKPGGDCPPLPLIDGEGEATAIVWPGIGAHMRSLHRFVLSAGSQTVVQRHPSEAVYYLRNGSAEVADMDVGERSPLTAGSMVHVEPDTSYVFLAGDGGAEIVGGPCPADPSLYAHLIS